MILWSGDDFDTLRLADGLASERNGSAVRVFKAPAVGFEGFGFESDTAPFGLPDIDGDGGGLF